MAVMVIAVVPTSLPVLGVTLRLTVGKSLSVIVTEPDVVAPKTMPLDGAEIVNVPVSDPSIRASLLMLMVKEPVVCPLGIVIWVGIIPVKSVAPAVPVSATLTV